VVRHVVALPSVRVKLSLNRANTASPRSPAPRLQTAAPSSDPGGSDHRLGTNAIGVTRCDIHTRDEHYHAAVTASPADIARDLTTWLSTRS
jgi:hypothetical protein